MATNNNLNLAIKLTLSSAEFRAALKSSNDEVRQFAEKVGTQLKSAQASAKGTADSFGSIGSTVRALAGSAAGLYGAFQLKELATDAFNAAVEFDRQQRALTNVSGSAQQAASDFSFLSDIGDRMGQSVIGLSGSWINFANAVKDSSLEGEAGRKVFAGIVSTLADMNASSEQTNAVLYQVAQGINKEKVQLEDLNIIAERGIPIFRLLADALGLTKAELFDQISKGLIPADEAYRKVFGTVDNGTRRIEGMTQSLNRLSTEWNTFLVNLGNSAPIQGVIDLLGGLLKQLNDIEGAAKGVQLPTFGADAAQLEQKRAALEFQRQQLTSSPFGAADFAVKRIDEQLRAVERQQQIIQLLAAPKEQAAAEQTVFDKITAEQGKLAPLAPTEPPKYDKQKAAAIADYLESRGLSPLAVAGIVGNLAQEAPGGAGNLGTALSGDQGSIGLAQWRLDRKDALTAFAAQQGVPATDIKAQLDFLVAEAKARGDLAAVNAARSPSEAAAIFMRRFERPDEAKANLDYRAAVAEDVFAQSSLDRLRLASRTKSTRDESSTVSRIDEEQKLSEELTRIEEHRSEVIVKQREELRQKGIETYEQMVSDLQQAADEEGRIVQSRSAFEAQINAQAEVDFQRKQTAQKEFLQSAFDEKLISARDYYSALDKLAADELAHTQTRIDAEIALETKRLQAISATIEAVAAKSGNTTDLQVQQIESAGRLEALSAQRGAASADYQSTSREITRAATAAQAEPSAATNPIEKWANDFNAKLGDMSAFAFSAAQGMQNAFAQFFESGLQGTESLGQAFAKMARRIAAEIAAMMATKAIISFIGMLGGALGGIFAPASASTIPAVAPGVAGSGTPGLATGGLVGDPERAAMTAINGSVQKLIDGSQIQVISGPGTGTSDSIVADLPVGSYIIREKSMREMRFADGGTVRARVSAGEGFVPPGAVRAIGVDALDRINGLGAGLRTFAAGGLVESGSAVASPTVAGGDTITVNMPLTVSGMPGAQDPIDAGAKAQSLRRELRNAVDARIIELQRPGGLLWGAGRNG